MFRTKPGEGLALVEEWINRPALRKLVEAFGGTWPTGNLETIVADLAEFSTVWDYRSGDSRLMFHDEQDEVDPHQELTYQAAEELGLIKPAPPSAEEYDYLLILGGLATGVEPRVKYAAQLVSDGLRVRQQIAGLGSFRPLQERELPISTKYAPDGQYEIDHLSVMMAELFEIDGRWDETASGDPDIDPARASRIWTLPNNPEAKNEPTLATYAAASSKPDQRPADTRDTYMLFADINDLSEGEKVLIVTSAIYVPYQYMDAVQALSPFGVEIETVGLRRSEPGPTHPPHAYRQEIRSAIRSSERYFSARQ